MGPVVAMEWSGESAVSVARTLMGATDPKKADPGTIRGDFGLAVTQNIVHGSDSPESADGSWLFSSTERGRRRPRKP